MSQSSLVQFLFLSPLFRKSVLLTSRQTHVLAGLSNHVWDPVAGQRYLNPEFAHLNRPSHIERQFMLHLSMPKLPRRPRPLPNQGGLLVQVLLQVQGCQGGRSLLAADMEQLPLAALLIQLHLHLS